MELMLPNFLGTIMVVVIWSLVTHWGVNFDKFVKDSI